MTKYQYNSYPLGKVPIELQRPEIYKLKELGYEFNDAREIIDLFEKKVAEFAGCKYAVTTDCCSHGIYLALRYVESMGELNNSDYNITIPRRTYVSVAMQVMNIGFLIKFEDIEWSGIYQIKPTRVWDGAVRWTKGMYVGDNALQVVSFQFKKRVPIGKGGMILTDDFEAYKMLKLMSYDGRDLTLPYDHPEHIKTIGYHMYMTPEDAARGIILMDNVQEINEDSGNYTMYPDIEKMMKNIKF
jgi:dTDP-4-amino-4,6-dideoxygalactose transaminase